MHAVRSGLRRSAERMNRGEATTVAFIGGSVTAGAGASDAESTSYRALTCKYLQDRFPRTAFTFVNAAIGGTDSVYGAYRLKEDAFGRGVPDLLFIEFAVNDDGDRTRSIRAMEGMVRQARRLNPLINICFIYVANEQTADRYAETRKPQDNIAHHEEVAEHYGLPSVDIASRIYKRIAAGSLEWKEMSNDSVHPNDYGYSLYSQYLHEALDEILQPEPDDSGATGAVPLPDPIDAFCYERAGLVSPLTAECAAGWRMVRGWTHEMTCNWVPPADVFVADEPGAAFRVRFAGTVAGIALLAGMATGDLEYSIDGGPYRKAALFDRYCSKFYRPKIVMLADGLENGPHILDVVVSRENHECSMGTSIHILHFLL